MSTITSEKLREIIESHGRWRRGEPEGSRADLRGADLRGADLRGAVLRGADLSRADLSRADLSRADLRGADLSRAVLRGADLRGADLSRADLSRADLDKRYIQISCIGSRKDVTTYCFDDDHVWCGCWPNGTYRGGTLDEFEKQVRITHANNPQYLAEYLGFISYIRALKS
jgi:uncharacterized protein YjbI with pentapeptide repeats